MRTQIILVASYNKGWTTDVTWTILKMFLQLFNFSLTVMVTFPSMEGQRALKIIIENILTCVPKMNKGFTGLEQHEGEQLMAIFIFGWTIPLIRTL